MREPRASVLKLVKERPENSGRFKKELIIELYPANQWSEKYGPYSDQRKKCCFFYEDGENLVMHKPLTSMVQGRYYRLMVNGKWYQQDGYRYSFFTDDEAYRLLRESENANRQIRST